MKEAKIATLIIETEEALLGFLSKWDYSKVSVFDTERVGLSWEVPLLGVALYNPGGIPAYVAVENPYLTGVPWDVFKPLLQALFDRTVNWVNHNIKFDIIVLAQLGIKIPRYCGDSLLSAHVWNPDSLKNLETRVYEDLGVDKKAFKDIIGKKWESIRWNIDTLPRVKKNETLPPLITNAIIGHYAAEDVYYCWRLFEEYERRFALPENQGLRKVLDRIELPLIRVLADAQIRGVHIDVPLLRRYSEEITPDLHQLEEDIYSSAGCRFNLASPKQIGKVFFDTLGLPIVKTTKTGAPSTDEEALKMLANHHEVPNLLLAHHESAKLKGTYLDAIPELIDSDGRLRGSFNAAGTRTGRLSSQNPNLQNQPAHGALVSKYPVRKAFVPTPGYLFIGADYSQIEPRLMAHMSQDKLLIKTYEDNGDVYIGVAQALSITRKQAKVVVLALMYGMGPQKLADSLGISLKEAKSYLAGFMHNFSGFRQWKYHIEDTAKRTGQVTTLFGRRRLLPGASSKSGALFSAAMRQSVNTAVQGSAADLIKIAMINIYNDFQLHFPGQAHLLLQVHDELLAESPKSIAHQVVDVMRFRGENVVTLRVPIKFDPKVIRSWWDLKDDNYKGVPRSNILDYVQMYQM